MLNFVEGDLLKQHDVDAIVNTVNCVGVMGKGIALQFKNKWPKNFQAYQTACKAGEVVPGKMHVFDAGRLATPSYIINFPTKRHWRGKSKIEDIESGLDDLVAIIKKLDIESLAIPPLGCGNGGLSWSAVKSLIEKKLNALEHVDVRIFTPSGAPSVKTMEVNTTKARMTRGRAAVLSLIETYRELDYGLTQIEMQKLAYFLQETGEDLKLNFVEGKYGPYADTMRHVLNRMEGHYIQGAGDGSSDADIEPIGDALGRAEKFLISEGQDEILKRVSEVKNLIEGFQSPYGMELLATVHWVAIRDSITSVEQAAEAVHAWNDRKKKLMKPNHIAVAWERLTSQNWVNTPA